MATETSSNPSGSIKVEAQGGETSGFGKITTPQGTILAIYNTLGEGSIITENDHKILTKNEKATREAVEAIRKIAANGPIVNANAEALNILAADLRDNGKIDSSAGRGRIR